MNKIYLFRKIDKYFGNLICLILWPFKLIFNSKFPEKPKKILIIKLWAIGESVLILPMINSLKNKYRKDARITILARNQNKDVFSDNKDIDNIILFEFNNLINLIKRFNNYDLAIDAEPFFRISAILSFWLSKYTIGFSYSIRSLLYDSKIEYNDKQHAVRTYLDISRSIGINKDYKELIPLNFSTSDRENIYHKLNLKKENDEILVGIAPGSGQSALGRRWDINNFFTIAKLIKNNHKSKIIFCGDKNDRELIERNNASTDFINLAGIISLKEFFALMKSLDVFIGNDSGPIHIAAAQGVKTIGLYGPNTPVRFSPFGSGNFSIYKNINPPVINVHKGEIPSNFLDSKEFGMDKITVEEVYEVFLKCLNK